MDSRLCQVITPDMAEWVTPNTAEMRLSTLHDRSVAESRIKIDG